MSQNKLSRNDRALDLTFYAEFVKQMSLDEVKCTNQFMSRLEELSEHDSCESFSRLMSGAMGLVTEASTVQKTITDIIYNKEALDFHTVDVIRTELGDVLFFWMQVCIALNIDPEDVLEVNRQKILARNTEDPIIACTSTKRTVNDL